jgi:hypothetical protein
MPNLDDSAISNLKFPILVFAIRSLQFIFFIAEIPAMEK